MKFSVRNIVIASVVMAAAAVTAVSASAETHLNVPFSFTVAGKVCPAGVYLVNKDLNTRLVTLTSKNTPETFRWLVNPGSPAPNDSRVTLRFDEVGDSYTLKSVQYGALITSNLDKKSKTNENVSVRIIQGQ